MQARVSMLHTCVCTCVGVGVEEGYSQGEDLSRMDTEAASQALAEIALQGYGSFQRVFF